jgi:hypothetical protein
VLGVPHLDEGSAVTERSNTMAPTKGRHTERSIGYHADPEASAHDLMNESLQWLQYARGLTGLLADLIHEADSVDCQRVAIGLEAIGALTHMGVQCTAQAHVRVCWEQVSKGDAADR